MASYSDREVVVRAFVEQWRKDRSEGVEGSLEDYLERFPGHAKFVAAEFLALEAKARTEASRDEIAVGPYRTIREIGRGGQGVVYLAEDMRFGRPVALKVLSKMGPVAEEVLARFRREALVASRLNHPGICGVLDADIEGGVPYIAMPFIDGKTLAQKLRKLDDARKTSSSSAVDKRQIMDFLWLFERSARALHAAHEAGVVHRDLKPANLMISKDGTPILLDFGLAATEDFDLESLTASGDLFGTPAYMSPEQLSRTNLRLDRRSDVYSLGASLFEALTLKKPFEEASRAALYNAILKRDVPFVRHLNPAVSRDLAIVVSKSVEKDRERRYATAEEFADELRRVRERQPIVARPIGPMTRSARWAQRNPVVAGLLATVIIVLSVSTILTTFWATRATDALEDKTLALNAEEAERRAKEAALDSESQALADMTAARGAEAEALARTTVALRAEEAERGAKEAALLEYQRLADSKALAKAKERSDELWPVSPQIEAELVRWQAEFGALFEEATLHGHEQALKRLRERADSYTEEDRRRDFSVELAEIVRLAGAESQLLEEIAAGSSEQRAAAEEKLTGLSGRLAELREVVQGRRDWRFASNEDDFRHEILAQLVAELRALTAKDQVGVQQSIADRLLRAKAIEQLSVTGELAEKRWEVAIARVRSSELYRLSAEQRKRLVAMGGPAALFEESGAMRLGPQLGLVPLGPSPTSGLEEFLHLESHAFDWSKGVIALPKRVAKVEGSGGGGIVMRPETGVVLVLIPGGTFLMGSQKTNAENPNFDPDHDEAIEGPAHEVTLAPYFLSKYEVTQAQWARNATRTGAAPPRPSAYGIGAFAGVTDILPSEVDGTHPVTDVDGYMSSKWLARSGLQLPTEAQWERAARATTPSMIWPGVSAVSGLARIANVSGRETTTAVPSWSRTGEHVDAYVVHAPVGSFGSNGFGLYDTIGNVWEWCRDAYVGYDVTPSGSDGLRAPPARDRVVRGGSFANPASMARVASRLAFAQTQRLRNLGLRPARSLTTE